METQKIATRFWLILGITVALVGFLGTHRARAATLSFSPQSGTYLSGRSFSVSVLIFSPNQAMNAAQGEISFSTNDLEVLSISESNSICNLWVQDPTFSNQDGTIDFGGVAVNPGFQGNGGNIITIRFEAKNSGSAALSFVSGSILANDGKGTNILTSMGNAEFTITPLTSAPPSTVQTPANGNAPSTIIINSNPPIVSGEWYDINHITFNWSAPINAEGVDYTISPNPNLQLPDVNQGLVSQVGYDLSQFSDGIWYFYVSFNNGSAWSPPFTRELMLDRTPPEQFVITRTDTDLTDPRPIFAWTAIDQTSGIDHYDVKIGDGDWFDASSIQNGSSSYMLPLQSPGVARTLTVRAFDKAGNYTDATTNFTVLAPVVLCKGSSFSCAVQLFFAKWGVFVSIVFILLVFVLYGFLYYLLRWRKQSRKDLEKFKDELQKDLRRVEEGVKKVSGTEIDLRQSHFIEEKRSLEKELHHITEEVKEELKRLNKDK